MSFRNKTLATCTRIYIICTTRSSKRFLKNVAYYEQSYIRALSPRKEDDKIGRFKLQSGQNNETIIKHASHNTIGCINIMYRHYVQGNYKQCVDTLAHWLNNNQNIPSMEQMDMKCAALVNMIQSSDLTFEEKCGLYSEIEHTIYNQLQLYGLNIDVNIAKKQLDGAIYLHYQTDPMRIIAIFESMVNNNVIAFSKGELIDLRAFEPWQAQIIICYIFGFKLHEFVNKGDRKICMMIGEGNNVLFRVVRDELASWIPPIHCAIAPFDRGLACMRVKQLTPYLLNDNNFAVQRLNDSFTKLYIPPQK